eukprot:gb/GFBE01054913.1/.p1 GENE.gb/GFBE01054913.1/~~gb/GFBE01054913.1/.p1  ORF type:complete len:101 (+),score=13.61 gb/GFBE01054913.1/:1-303(+)
MAVAAGNAWRQLVGKEGRSILTAQLKGQTAHRTSWASSYSQFDGSSVWRLAYADARPSSLTYVPMTQAGRLLVAADPFSQPRLAYERRRRVAEEDFETFV